MSNFLYKNIMWTFNRKNDENLLTLPTTESQYITQLEKLAEKYYPEKKTDRLYKNGVLSKSGGVTAQ